MTPEDLSALSTESVNPATRDLDRMDTLALVKLWQAFSGTKHKVG